MTLQTIGLNPYLSRTLNSLSQSEVLAAIELLQHRLHLMQSHDYYLHITIVELPIPPGIQAHMLQRNILTVRDLLLLDAEQLSAIRGVGQKNLQLLIKLLATIEQRKEIIKGLSGDELWAALV